MQLQQTVKSVFVQLSESLHRLTDAQYIQPSKTLFNATIGQHVRHIIELFICLEKGYDAGIVNYEKRKRDLVIEADKDFANRLLQEIYANLEKPNKRLLLESNYDEHSAEALTVTTNYYREIIYNLEHTVHHMALIRVGINEVSAIEVPEGFGVASSTIKYRKHVHSKFYTSKG
ncbi:MAG: DinB family protein [Bacteroidetes bacterium]|nr:MAG: DinB family protein [Bacteroidota bacterium]